MESTQFVELIDSKCKKPENGDGNGKKPTNAYHKCVKSIIHKVRLSAREQRQTQTQSYTNQVIYETINQ